MMNLELQAIYVMWLRQMKRFIRSKSRLLVSIIQPLFFLLILGSGFNQLQLAEIGNVEYRSFLAPGIITMAIVFSSMFTGISVLWDKQFGFLQEVLVAPVSRLSIIIGRTLGGASVALVQGFIILLISIFLGIPFSGPVGIILTLIFMLFIAFTAVGFGLIFASKMNDFQSFPIIMNLVMMPLILLSSAFFTVIDTPLLLTIARVNPVFYMVDGLRGSLFGPAYLGSLYVNPPYVNLIVVLLLSLVTISIGSYSFSKSEA
ncbi:MAG: ABC transporter permease [Candidatus Thermoplasmatota archaeon]|nr:ABC transporter permease [Candidatus Thermoplasmatota archaeon]